MNLNGIGCEHCRKFGVGHVPDATRRVAVRLSSTFLDVCDHCGTYWEFVDQTVRVISKADAQRLYREHFRAASASFLLAFAAEAKKKTEDT